MGKVHSYNRSTNNHKLLTTPIDKKKKNDVLRQKGVVPPTAWTSWTKALFQGFGVLVIASATYYALTSLFQKTRGIDNRVDFQARYMHPGIQLDKTGTSGCRMDLSAADFVSHNPSGILTPDQCDENVYSLQQSVDQAQEGLRGYQWGDRSYLLNLSPLLMDSYRMAANVFHRAGFNKEIFFEASTSMIVELIKSTHGMLTVQRPGEFRNFCDFVFHPKMNEPDKRIEFLQQNNVTEDFIEIARNGMRDSCHPTANETEVFSRLGYFRPNPEKIESELTGLVSRLQNSAAHGADCVTLATDWHQGFGRLQVFDEGNALVARLFMNEFLRHCDIKPQVFPNAEHYEWAFFEDLSLIHI